MILIQRYLQLIISLGIVGGAVWGALNTFATAADVDKKFNAVRYEMRKESTVLQKRMIEIELFKLRSSGKDDPVTRAQIDQFDTELRNINAKIREMDLRNGN